MKPHTNTQIENGKIIDASLAINEKFRALRPELQQYLGHVSYAIDYCSIHFDTGRMSGKTTWIKNTAKAGDLIVVRNVDTGKHQFAKVPATVLSIKQIPLAKPHRTFNRVFFDDSKFMNHSEILTAYQILAKKGASQMFIHIG